MECKIGKIPILIVPFYGPRDDNPEWWAKLKARVNLKDYQHIILGGDSNVIQNMTLDQKHYRGQHKPRSQRKLQSWHDQDFVHDVFRHMHPDKVEFTWAPFTVNPRERRITSRIDIVLASPRLLPFVKKITHEYRFHNLIDHNGVTIEIDFEGVSKMKGPFRSPTNLTTDPLYIETINNVIKKTVVESTVAHHTEAELAILTTENLLAEDMLISSSDLLDLILLNCQNTTKEYIRERNIIRNRTKDKIDENIKQLTKDVKNYPNNNFKQNLLTNAINDMTEYLREKANVDLKYLRNRWINEGEKPSAWYLKLAK